MYTTEVEPHALLQWDHELWNDTGSGFGPGVRVNIPFLDNGPIDTINNNMAIGFGFDWAHYSDACNFRGFGFGFDDAYDINCTGNVFLVPGTLQWNFFLTPRISVFGEPGFALAHYSWKVSIENQCVGTNCGFEYSDSTTKLWFVFWGGARFMLSDNIAFTARVGTPYVSAGVSFLM